jgi:hypothetical protein
VERNYRKKDERIERGRKEIKDGGNTGHETDGRKEGEEEDREERRIELIQEAYATFLGK